MGFRQEFAAGGARQTPVLVSFSLTPPSTMRALLPLIAFAVLLAGCGYKAPLYLPQSRPEAQKTVPPPASQPDEKKPAAEPR